MAVLVHGALEIRIERIRRYPNIWKVTGEDFYFHEQTVRRSPGLSLNPFTPTKYLVQPRQDDLILHYRAWLDNTLVMYRGIAASHHCWEHLRANSILISEGPHDEPTMTMGAGWGNGTCWLPVGPLALAQGVTLSDMTDAVEVASNTRPVLVGITLGFRLGHDRGVPFCYINTGEMVVKGPLMFGAYHAYSMNWVSERLYTDHVWPGALVGTNIPTARPFRALAPAPVLAWITANNAWFTAVENWLPPLLAQRLASEARALPLVAPVVVAPVVPVAPVLPAVDSPAGKMPV
ncbi:MAG: hypothetical protein V4505_17890 [Pseudomonadota bacterium]